MHRFMWVNFIEWDESLGNFFDAGAGAHVMLQLARTQSGEPESHLDMCRSVWNVRSPTQSWLYLKLHVRQRRS